MCSPRFEHSQINVIQNCPTQLSLRLIKLSFILLRRLMLNKKKQWIILVRNESGEKNRKKVNWSGEDLQGKAKLRDITRESLQRFTSFSQRQWLSARWSVNSISALGKSRFGGEELELFPAQLEAYLSHLLQGNSSAMQCTTHLGSGKKSCWVSIWKLPPCPEN